jgi:ribosomal protein S12 methylthiotransferase accessory factor YcaO
VAGFDQLGIAGHPAAGFGAGHHHRFAAARAVPEKFLRGLLAITLTSVAVKLIW